MTAVSNGPKPEVCPLPGRFWVNTLAQGVLRQFTQWPWIEHVTCQLRGGHFTTEIVSPPIANLKCTPSDRQSTPRGTCTSGWQPCASGCSIKHETFTRGFWWHSRGHTCVLYRCRRAIYHVLFTIASFHWRLTVRDARTRVTSSIECGTQRWW